jgi:type VI secretion system FHA domain protein
MRELVVGITEALHLRAEQKNTLRLPHTTIQQNNNNPLKFSAGVDEALTNLFFKRAPEYMPAVESVREAFQNIRAHQQALLAAMQAALIDYIERMDPEELERKFNRGGKPNALMGAANKMKYWDLYTDLYQVMARHSPGQFPQLFAEDLTRAYEDEAARLQGKRPQQPPKAKAG